MKKITFYLCLLTLLIAGASRAQTPVFHSVSLVTDLSTYTVTAAFDTTFSRELIITMNDTAGFRSLQASISLQENGKLNQVKTVTLLKPSADGRRCTEELCLYRKNSMQWVLVLGAYPLSTRHRISLHFTSLFTNTTNTNWTQEF